MRKETQKLLVLSLLGLVSVNLAAQQKAKKDTIKGLDEVVVTALGIKRHDRALGYVAEKVDAKTFEETQNNNWAQSMEGKVAGLKVQTAGAGPLGTSRITLRGEKSIMMDHNYALIVVEMEYHWEILPQVPEQRRTELVPEVMFRLILEMA